MYISTGLALGVQLAHGSSHNKTIKHESMREHGSGHPKEDRKNREQDNLLKTFPALRE
jgi:hypothetical protein